MIYRPQAGRVIAAAHARSRKVRTPESTVPGNSRSGDLASPGNLLDRATETYRRWMVQGPLCTITGKGEKVVRTPGVPGRTDPVLL